MSSCSTRYVPASRSASVANERAGLEETQLTPFATNRATLWEETPPRLPLESTELVPRRRPTSESRIPPRHSLTTRRNLYVPLSHSVARADDLNDAGEGVGEGRSHRGSHWQVGRRCQLAHEPLRIGPLQGLEARWTLLRAYSPWRSPVPRNDHHRESRRRFDDPIRWSED